MSRFKLTITALVTTLCLSYLFSRDGWQTRGKLTHPKSVLSPENARLHGQFWNTFEAVLTTHEPLCPSPEPEGKAESVRYEPYEEVQRPNLIHMPESDVREMRKKHTGFVNTLETLHPHYIPGTRGLVTTAGGSHLPVLTISLRMLRRFGSKLPVEVFLASDEEYEPYICEVVFLELNAKCIVLDNIFKAGSGATNIATYQYKPFAMLFSSFEEILFLDADAFPLRDPATLFTSEPFSSLGMVTWPDFWASTASAIYYRIASRPVPRTTARASTESGEILISKKSHKNSLMLATYYNYYGPSHYYTLFSQGATGEGDKETFIAAAGAVSDPFYQVSEPIRALGHRGGDDGDMVGSAVVQYDPMEDYRLTQSGRRRVKDATIAASPQPLFIHANVPKFNPATIFEPFVVDPVHDEDGSFTRPWTVPEDTIAQFGEEVEKQFWYEIESVACELEDKFESWKDKTDVCKNIRAYCRVVFPS